MSTHAALEFHDSEVSSVEFQGENFVIRLPAGYVHRSNGRPGIDDGAGFIQALEIACLGPVDVQQDPGCVGALSHGVLRADGQTLVMLPIPYEASGNIELELTFSNGSICRVHSRGITLKALGDARFVEWFKC